MLQRSFRQYVVMVEKKNQSQLYPLHTKMWKEHWFWWNVVCCNVYLKKKCMNLHKSSKSKKLILWTKKKNLRILYRSLKALNFIHLCPVWKTFLYKTFARMQLMEMCSGSKNWTDSSFTWVTMSLPTLTYPIHPIYSLRAPTDHVNAIINSAPVILHQTFMKSLP